MGGWAYYFLAKVFLHLRGHIPFDLWANLAFAAWVLVPIPDSLRPVRALVWSRRLLTGCAALLLAWHDSWLPALPDAMTFVRDTPLPTGGFLARLAIDSVASVEVATLAAILVGALVVGRYVRLTPVVLALLAVVAIRVYGGAPVGVDGALASFYAREAERTVAFSEPSGRPFDVAVLHVCSLSWDDLDAVGLARDPFFDQFDVLLTRFNSVTAHSNPSAIRLLRSTCGQSPHEALYRPAQPECYLPDALASSGYRLYAALNHDGRYGGFVEQVSAFGHAPGPSALDGLPVRQIDFAGSSVYDDGAVLADWWARRRADGAPRAMLYYNTITLHDGGHGVGDGGWWTRDRTDQYREAAQTLFGDLERFSARIEADGGRAVVVVVAEHGMALRGSRLQPAGLREVPLPSITTVPVGIKFVGPGWFRGARPHQQVIDRPTSYLAVAGILSDLIGRSEFDLIEADIRQLADRAPSTAFVAENNGAVVVRDGDRDMAKGRSFGMEWVELPAGGPGQGS